MIRISSAECDETFFFQPEKFFHIIFQLTPFISLDHRVQQIFTLHSARTTWKRGEDFDAFLEQIENASYDANDVAIFTAHQLCSCRMGSDPSTSVADGRGQLHDTKGVWIGDASAFPTAPGVNPMISIMSLAHRTAGEILKG